MLKIMVLCASNWTQIRNPAISVSSSIGCAGDNVLGRLAMAATVTGAVTAKDRVIDEAPGWTEEQAARALRAAQNGATSPQPPFSLIGAFHSGPGDLSEGASRDEYEPERFR
jgi:hypothetical protein